MNETEQLENELEQARQRIAELEAVEETLKAAEWEKEMILDSQLEHVVYQDLHNKVLWVNRAAFESVGATREELIGRYCYEIWAGRDEPCEDCPVIQAFETGQVQEVEKETPDGRIWFIRGYPVRDRDGKIVSGIEITQEITERKRLEKELVGVQQQALQELLTPIIPVMDRIIVMPLVGSIDSARAKQIMRALLEGIRAHRAKVVILDITGVPIIDSGVATHLDKTIQAARLKGARTIITGISDAVAEAVVDLGINWNKLQTLSNLQTGLVVALDELGIKLSKK